jgi:hypothetical protein
MSTKALIYVRGSLMPKALCLFSLAISGLVLLLFGGDMVLQIAGMTTLAPLSGASMLMDASFTVVAILVAAMSWFTYREQV